MIASVTGHLESLEGGVAEVRPSGLGLSLELLLPAYEAETLQPRLGETVTLRTMAYLESHGQGASMSPRLIGFASPRDRRFFELFTTVKGLGNRKALRALIHPPDQVAGLIRARDAAGLQKMPEVGKRLAETIIAELSGKVDDYLGQASGVEAAGPRAIEAKPGAALSGAGSEAVAALIALGETPDRAEARIQEAQGRLGDEASADELVAATFTGG